MSHFPPPPPPLTNKVNLNIKKSKGKTTISEQNLRFLTCFQIKEKRKKTNDNHYTTETATGKYVKLEMSYRGARNF